MVHTRYPKTTNAERHNIRWAKKNGGNNGKWLFCTNFGISVFKNRIHVLKGRCLPRISEKSWF